MVHVDRFVSDEFINHVPVMFLQNDHRLGFFSVAIVEFVGTLFNHLNVGVNLLAVNLPQLFEWVLIDCRVGHELHQSRLYSLCPFYLIVSE